MKTQLLAAAVVLATSIQAYGQSCGCESNHVATRSVASCGCDRCCTPCFNPLGELVEGVGFTLKTGACAVKRGVHSLFHPIRFNGCGCDTTPSCGSSCGCDTCGSGSNWDGYHSHQPGVEYIEQGHPSVPTIPGPPMTPTSEPTLMREPGKWQPVGTQAKRSSNQVSHYSKRVAAKPTTRSATYYAPTPAK
ncbi:hypothetical protein [Bremerella alba]|uniref:Uncharacterized protein n=1 Tax=Bremerella alba TaxID=980252 RepID=A0A7V8V2Z9_9BACT|nr:hypothetical protein [Bremerella alba]MBA2113983.1 hypothetical protein [Bremerella alba]